MKSRILSKKSLQIAVFLIVMTIVNLFSSNVASAENEESSEKPKQIDITSLSSMSLEQAIEIAINNSIQYKIDDINIALKEEALRQAKENAVFLGDAYGTERILNNRIIKEVRPFEAEIPWKLQRRQKKII